MGRLEEKELDRFVQMDDEAIDTESCEVLPDYV